MKDKIKKKISTESSIFYLIFFVGFFGLAIFCFNIENILYKKTEIQSPIITEIIQINNLENNIEQSNIICKDNQGKEYTVHVGNEICYLAEIGDKAEIKITELTNRKTKEKNIRNEFIALIEQ